MNPPVDSAFDIQNALRLLDAAALAYAPALSRDATVLSSRAGDTRVLVLADDTDAVIAFRGTANLRNLLTDLECELTPWRAPHVRVHAGFLAAWRSVREAVLAAVANLGPNRRLWLTGHSLGGALATLAALDLKLEIPDAGCLAGCYTFGQPRVGNAEFRHWFNALLCERAFRVVYSNDVVTRVPWLLGAYRHIGHEVFFPPSGTLNFEPGTLNYRLDPGFWFRLPFAVISLFRAWGRGCDAVLADHHINAYLNLIARAPAGLIQRPAPKLNQ